MSLNDRVNQLERRLDAALFNSPTQREARPHGLRNGRWCGKLTSALTAGGTATAEIWIWDIADEEFQVTTHEITGVVSFYHETIPDETPVILEYIGNTWVCWPRDPYVNWMFTAGLQTTIDDDDSLGHGLTYDAGTGIVIDRPIYIETTTQASGSVSWGDVSSLAADLIGIKALANVSLLCEFESTVRPYNYTFNSSSSSSHSVVMGYTVIDDDGTWLSHTGTAEARFYHLEQAITGTATVDGSDWPVDCGTYHFYDQQNQTLILSRVITLTANQKVFPILRRSTGTGQDFEYFGTSCKVTELLP